ncbi:MAG: NAD-dependent epimerase/dehydratase family protein [Bradyrhizobiaceae bacterium]|nr:NAD-dependent epimerase/dehydratase family protein [Hyphomicrobiales bacterium]MBV9428249.1 NAD-dependent epimerase/dehydratase family protein [Bradyrhizobiaceae bacterium]
MRNLVCIGLGYCAVRYAGMFGKKFDRVVGTTRELRGSVRSPGLRTVDIIPFDGRTASPEVVARVEESDAVLISAPPGQSGDPVLASLADNIARGRARSIVYLSTIGVYGDTGGAWVDEGSAPRPGSARSAARLAAEEAWRRFADQHGKSVAILRLAGIYGPGRNALVTLSEGKARRIVKPGQVFNRIHVTDIAQAIDASFAQRATGVFNLADDEPAPPQDVIAFAADLMGKPPPPEIPFDEARAGMSPMARSFYAENRRVRNAKLKQTLGVCLVYPTYREGLQALFNARIANGE